jgi:threonine synthase
LYAQEGEEVDIFVPTGAAGNVSAAILASLMGASINLFVATNENDNVEAFFNKGELRIGGEVKSTPASAMDIGSAYNLERILYFISGSVDVTADLMTRAETNSVQVPLELLAKIRQFVIGCKKVSTDTIYETILSCWELNDYIVRLFLFIE